MLDFFKEKVRAIATVMLLWPMLMPLLARNFNVGEGEHVKNLSMTLICKSSCQGKM
jgi:hypothetical protein